MGGGRRGEIFPEPGDPATIDVARVDGVTRAVARYRVRNELRGDAVVAERVIELVRLRDGYAEIAGVGENQRRRLDFPGVVDRRLLQVLLHALGGGIG